MKQSLSIRTSQAWKGKWIFAGDTDRSKWVLVPAEMGHRGPFAPLWGALPVDHSSAGGTDSLPHSAPPYPASQRQEHSSFLNLPWRHCPLHLTVGTALH